MSLQHSLAQAVVPEAASERCQAGGEEVRGALHQVCSSEAVCTLLIGTVRFLFFISLLNYFIGFLKFSKEN